jgi:hypothetical protein
MLDSALSVVGIPCATLGGYIADRRYKLIKVHGSVDWGHPAGLFDIRDGKAMAHRLMADVTTLSIDKKSEVISSPEVTFPALCGVSAQKSTSTRRASRSRRSHGYQLGEVWLGGGNGRSDGLLFKSLKKVACLLDPKGQQPPE